MPKAAKPCSQLPRPLYLPVCGISTTCTQAAEMGLSYPALPTLSSGFHNLRAFHGTFPEEVKGIQFIFEPKPESFSAGAQASRERVTGVNRLVRPATPCPLVQ